MPPWRHLANHHIVNMFKDNHMHGNAQRGRRSRSRLALSSPNRQSSVVTGVHRLPPELVFCQNPQHSEDRSGRDCSWAKGGVEAACAVEGREVTSYPVGSDRNLRSLAFEPGPLAALGPNAFDSDCVRVNAASFCSLASIPLHTGSLSARQELD